MISSWVEPLRAGLSRAEREAMAFRVRKFPRVDDEDDQDNEDGDDDEDYEDSSPRTAPQGAKGLPQKMPRKIAKQRSEEVAIESTSNDTTTSVSATSAKRALKDVNGTNEDAEKSVSKKPKVAAAADARARDIQTIEAILGDIKDPAVRAALENIIKVPTKETAGTSSVAAQKKDGAMLDKLTHGTVRTIQKLINDRLKWKNSYKYLKGGDTKGGRVEVVCNEPEVFERIFEGATTKKGKDGKLSCSLKSEDDVHKSNLKFKGKRYRYGSSYLCAPYTASLKDNILTFGFKFGVW